MNTAITKRRTGSIRLNTEKILSLGGVKAAAAAILGFVSALPVKLLGISPFAVAAVAVVPRSWVFICYLGSFFSYMTNSFYSSAASLSAATAVMLFRLIFKGRGKTVSDAYIAPLSVFLSLTVTGILCGDIRMSDPAGSFEWLAVSAVAAGASFVFGASIGLYGKSLFRLSPSRLSCAAASVFLLLLPLESLKPFGVSLLAVSATAAALIVCVRLGGTESFFAAAYFGAAWAAGAMRAEYFFILPVSVMAARALFTLGKLPCAAGFIALRFGFNLIFAPINELLPQMVEVLIAAFALVAVPKRMLTRTSLIALQADDPSAEERAAQKLKDTAGLFRYLSKNIAGVSAELSRELAPTPEKCVSYVHDTLCGNCELSKFCIGVKRNEIYEGVYKYAEDAIKGTASAAVLPRCAHLNEMETRIRDYMLPDASPEAGGEDLRELSTSIYGIVSEALEDVSSETATEIHSSEQAAISSNDIDVGCLSVKNSSETSSGDNCEYFTQGNFLYVIISDGMGSGRLASIDSGMTCRLLKRFIMNGLSIGTALKLANAALKLKGGEESFATADVCRLDVETGSFTLTKAGAAASYIVSENRVRRLYSPTLPVGILNEARYETITSKLKRNDALVMLSDGAVNNGDEWFDNARLYGKNSKDICETIIKIGRESYGSSPADDITAVCVKLK